MALEHQTLTRRGTSDSCGDAAPLAGLKKINSKTLDQHIKRSQFVAKMWKMVDEAEPLYGENATDSGWKEIDNSVWYSGSHVSDTLTSDDAGHIHDSGDGDSDDPWSDDSDDSDEE